MRSRRSYWDLSYVIHNLLTYTAVVGLQHQFLYALPSRNVDAAIEGKISANINLGISSLSSVTSSSSSSISTLFSPSSTSSRAETERQLIFRNKHHHERHWGPFFEESLNSTTAGDSSTTETHLFTESVLNCRVGMLKDKTVMWLRRTSEKVSLLTAGNVTYSSDPRIRVRFQYPNNWRLHINPTLWDDAGIYVCQVSTHPPRVFTTNLTVIEPPLRLVDDQKRDIGDRFYKIGSTIHLYCQVSLTFLYKEKQNIFKSIKPIKINKDSNNITSGGSCCNSVAARISRRSFLETDNKSSVSGNKLKSVYNNNSNNDQTERTANKNKRQATFEYDLKIRRITERDVQSFDGFDVLNNDLLQHMKQSTTSGDKQIIGLEKEFSNLVFWSKDKEALSSAILEHSSSDKWFTSRVTITDAKLNDSGNYSCSIGRMYMAIVHVQVLTGEIPAAVQHNSAAIFVALNDSLMELIQLLRIYITTAFFLLN